MSNSFYCISDIHHKIHLVKRFLKEYNPEKCIWTGDFQDAFDDGPVDTAITAAFMKEILLSRPNDKFALSNHEIAYLYPNQEKYHGWGWSKEKQKAFDTYFSKELWNKFRLFHTEPFRDHKIVFSHAGFISNFLPNGKFDDEFCRRVEKQHFEYGNKKDYNPWFDNEKGPLWKRWELPIVQGISQILGHTFLKRPAVITDGKYFNINFDTGCKYVGLIENDEIYSINLYTKEKVKLT